MLVYLVEPVVERREVLVHDVEAHEVDRMGGQEELVRGIEDHLPAKVIALKPVTERERERADEER
jgi:hypothetical protein